MPFSCLLDSYLIPKVQTHLSLCSSPRQDGYLEPGSLSAWGGGRVAVLVNRPPLWGWRGEGPHRGLFGSIKSEVNSSPILLVPHFAHALDTQWTLLRERIPHHAHPSLGGGGTGPPQTPALWDSTLGVTPHQPMWCPYLFSCLLCLILFHCLKSTVNNRAHPQHLEWCLKPGRRFINTWVVNKQMNDAQIKVQVGIRRENRVWGLLLSGFVLYLNERTEERTVIWVPN